MLLEISGEITPERMKGWSQSKKNTHLWMGLVIEARSDACCKEQYCIGTWNVRSMNQGKLEVVTQEVARVNIDILGISKLKCTGMGEFNSNHHYLFPAVIPAGSCFTIIYFILFLSLGNQKYYYNNKRCLLSFIL